MRANQIGITRDVARDAVGRTGRRAWAPPVSRWCGGALLLVASVACGPAASGDATSGNADAVTPGTGAAASGTAAADDRDVTLVGEITGLLVWRTVSEATAYRFELLGAGGAVVYTVESADTVAALPPQFTPAPESAWRVRALRDGRVVATSRVARIY